MLTLSYCNVLVVWRRRWCESGEWSAMQTTRPRLRLRLDSGQESRRTVRVGLPPWCGTPGSAHGDSWRESCPLHCSRLIVHPTSYSPAASNCWSQQLTSLNCGLSVKWAGRVASTSPALGALLLSCCRAGLHPSFQGARALITSTTQRYIKGMLLRGPNRPIFLLYHVLILLSFPFGRPKKWVFRPNSVWGRTNPGLAFQNKFRYSPF